MYGRDTQPAVVSSSVGWMRGFAKCGRANAVLGLGVNNKSDGGADPATAGGLLAAASRLGMRVRLTAFGEEQPGRDAQLIAAAAWLEQCWRRGPN